MSLNADGIFDNAYNGNIPLVKKAVEENNKVLLEKDTVSFFLLSFFLKSFSLDVSNWIYQALYWH